MKYPMTPEEFRKAVSERIAQDLKISPDDLNKLLNDNQDVLDMLYKTECELFDGKAPGRGPEERKKAFSKAAIGAAAFNLEMLY